MIFVDRSTVKEPLSLASPNGKGAKERARLIKHYSSLVTHQTAPKTKETKKNEKTEETTAPKKPGFNAYRSEDVKQALEKLFHEKCAYCESQYKAVMTGHVEHFRPKASVFEDSNHKGYWWLASTWTNLLLSCSHCNGSEYHEVHQLTDEQPYTQNTSAGGYKLGKHHYFPIGGQRAINEGDDLDLEDAYLIDPTRRNPDDHLQWIVEGGLSLVAPKKVGSDWDTYGLHTYQIFGLNRKNLVEERTELMLRVKQRLLKARNHLTKATTLEPGEYRDHLCNEAIEIVKEIKNLSSPSMPYSAMVNKLLDEDPSEVIADLIATIN